jgi:hypothetical protein
MHSPAIDDTSILTKRQYVPYTVGKTYVKVENIDLDELQVSLIPQGCSTKYSLFFFSYPALKFYLNLFRSRYQIL